MIKFVKIACVGLLSSNFMFGGAKHSTLYVPLGDPQEEESEIGVFDEGKFTALKNDINPSAKDFFVVAVTRDKKSDLTPSEIEIFKLLLQQLFERPMTKDECKENFEKDLLSKESLIRNANGLQSYLRLLEDFDEYTAEDKETLPSIIRKFNCSNMGTPPASADSDDVFSITSITKTGDFSLEELKNASALIAFNEYFFGETPCPHETAKNYSKNFSKINHCLWGCNFLTYTGDFKPEQVERNINIFNATQGGTEPLTITSKILKKESNGKVMTENKTFYTLQDREPTIVSTYNKSSYYLECDDFLTSEQAFYYFGDKKDLYFNPTSSIAQNISTEICRDVALGLRKGDINPVNLHLIQSNTLNHLADSSSAFNLPPAWCYIFCDSKVASRTLDERAREGRSHVYFNAVARNTFFKPCYSCSFMFHNYNFSIDVYKIISLE
ncbi:MAG: hypothetical protein ACSW8C_01360 [bacterium]